MTASDFANFQAGNDDFSFYSEYAAAAVAHGSRSGIACSYKL
jgi:hypothetical protein